VKSLIVLVSTLLACQISFAQHSDKPEVFNAADYPSDKYGIKLDSAIFLNYKIEFRQLKSLVMKRDDTTAISCRAWVTIRNKGKITKQIYFKNIEAVGSCSGLFIPAVQPKQDVFIFSKFGDYDGVIYFVDVHGKITEKSGGVFYLSADKRYLFSPYYSDLAGITIYDLEKKHILYSFDLESHLEDWYFQDGTYFAIASTTENLYTKIKIANFDLSTNQITFSTVDRNYPKAENKLEIHNDYSQKDCNCGK
jgi:hypothetical protein